jgi:hypothetical protein
MKLKAHFQDQSIPKDQRLRAEADLEAYLIDHFDGEKNAFIQKQAFNMQGKPPKHPWNIAIVKGIGLATRGFPPSSCRGVDGKGLKCEISFMDD